MLTAAQKRTLAFIQRFIEENGHSPTVSEIAEGTGIQSKGVAHRYIKALCETGHLELLPQRHRNIQLLSASNDTIPLMGRIAAGRPIEAIPGQDVLNFKDYFLGPNRYALRVQGDSMIEEGIKSNDIVICEHCEQADNGTIVVALIDQQEATLKFFYKNSDGTVTLTPANAELSPMVFEPDRVAIQGRMIGLVRQTV